MTVGETADQRATGFAHTALIIDTDLDLPAVLVPELRRSAEIYDEVLMVVGDRTRALLDGADLPGDVLNWGDSDAFYRRLGFAYESFRRYLAERHRAGRRVHVVAEPDLVSGVDPGLHAGRAAAYLAYEAICNETFAIGGSAVTCLWDSRRHSGAVIDGVRATHPHELTAAGPVPSSRYLTPERYLSARPDVPMPPAPAHVGHDLTLHEVAELRTLRSVLGDWADGHRFGAEAREDLLVAAVEVATNGLRHGGGPVRVRAWHQGDTLLVQCDDAGRSTIPAAAGYRRPHPVAAAAGGRGLWMARQLADVVTVSSAPGRTSVRLHFPQQLMQPSPA